MRFIFKLDFKYFVYRRIEREFPDRSLKTYNDNETDGKGI